MDRLRRLRSLQNAITVNEFRAIMVTDSVRPTTIQVIHYGEEAIREVFSCSKWLRHIQVFPAMIWQQNTNLYFILRERLDWRNLHALLVCRKVRIICFSRISPGSPYHIWAPLYFAFFMYHFSCISFFARCGWCWFPQVITLKLAVDYGLPPSLGRCYFHIWTFSVLARFLYLCVYLFNFFLFCSPS